MLQCPIPQIFNLYASKIAQDKSPTICSGGDISSPVTAMGDICAVNLDPHVSNQVLKSMDWGSLAVAPCAIVPAGKTYCYEVGKYGPLAVGLGVSDTALFGRRRLLLDSNVDPVLQLEDYLLSNSTHEDMHTALADGIASFEHWNSTAAPCSSLVAAHMREQDTRMGVMDLITLKQCLYWRTVANRTIHAHNLTILMVSFYHPAKFTSPLKCPFALAACFCAF